MQGEATLEERYAEAARQVAAEAGARFEQQSRRMYSPRASAHVARRRTDAFESLAVHGDLPSVLRSAAGAGPGAPRTGGRTRRTWRTRRPGSRAAARDRQSH